MKLRGIHHITAIASDPQANVDFYTQALGLRFAKRTVNFDDPSTYHVYYGDRTGRPGTALTFFAWPGARRGTRGPGRWLPRVSPFRKDRSSFGKRAWMSSTSSARRFPRASMRPRFVSSIRTD